MVTTRSGKNTIDKSNRSQHKTEKLESFNKKKQKKSEKQKEPTKKTKDLKEPQKDSPKKSDGLDTPNSTPIIKSPKAPVKSQKDYFYSEDELAKFKQFKLDLNPRSLQFLKDLCKKNQMKISGSKPDLIERIADAKVLGVIPKCPSCGGGRPKLDPNTKTYKCPGYLEDTVFKNCHKTFAYSEIARVPWLD